MLAPPFPLLVEERFPVPAGAPPSFGRDDPPALDEPRLPVPPVGPESEGLDPPPPDDVELEPELPEPRSDEPPAFPGLLESGCDVCPGFPGPWLEGRSGLREPWPGACPELP
jgi:hypothetical protein